MSGNRAALIDGSIATALVCALGLVFAFDRPSREDAGPRVDAPVVNEEPPPPPKPLVLAVSEPKFDDMGKLLDTLGQGFRYTQIPMDDFEDAEKLARYDVIFFTCGGVPESWLIRDGSSVAGSRGSVRLKRNLSVYNRVKEALRGFVQKGGTLYASDWRLNELNFCFPELMDSENVVEGDEQSLTAEVVDPGLRARLGSTVDLKFDQPGWYPAALKEKNATVYLRGTYAGNNGSRRVPSPLLVKLPFGQGTIIFTSFHNEKINSDLETKLLEFLVFESVLARESARVKKVLVSGNLSPRQQNILTASSGGRSDSLSYRKARRGRLVFALSFNNEGARLKLTVNGPKGEKFEKGGGTSFNVDVPEASAGEWSYTVTPVKVPYQNFPYNLTVGDE